MQITTAAQSLIGVISLGAFLVGLAQEMGDRQIEERKKIAQANLIAQYDVWKEGVIEAMLSVSSLPKFKTKANIEKLCSPMEFKSFYGGGPKTEWGELVKGLEYSPKYVGVIQAETRILEREIRSFTGAVSISDGDKLKRLTEYVTFLARYSNLEFSDESDKNDFFQGIWKLLGPSNVTTKDSFDLPSLLKGI